MICFTLLNKQGSGRRRKVFPPPHRHPTSLSRGAGACVALSQSHFSLSSEVEFRFGFLVSLPPTRTLCCSKAPCRGRIRARAHIGISLFRETNTSGTMCDTKFTAIKYFSPIWRDSASEPFSGELGEGCNSLVSSEKIMERTRVELFVRSAND